MLAGSLLENRKEFLEQAPSAPRIDHIFVFHQRGGIEFNAPRLRPSQVFLGKEAAAHGSIGQECDSVVAAEGRHPHLWSAVDERILDLVGGYAYPLADDDFEAFSIEVREREVLYFPFMLKIGEVLERVEVVAVGIVPPMELQQVERFDSHTPQRYAHRVFDGSSRHPPRMRYPLREGLDLRKRRISAPRGKFAPEIADEVLSGAVMVGEQSLERAFRVDAAMSAGDLPHSIEEPADRHIRRELESY